MHSQLTSLETAAQRILEAELNAVRSDLHLLGEQLHHPPLPSRLDWLTAVSGAFHETVGVARVNRKDRDPDAAGRQGQVVATDARTGRCNWVSSREAMSISAFSSMLPSSMRANSSPPRPCHGDIVAAFATKPGAELEAAEVAQAGGNELQP